MLRCSERMAHMSHWFMCEQLLYFLSGCTMRQTSPAQSKSGGGRTFVCGCISNADPFWIHGEACVHSSRISYSPDLTRLPDQDALFAPIAAASVEQVSCMGFAAYDPSD